MKAAHITHRRGFERVLAILSAFAMFMSLMVMFAPAALAHHPLISANQVCADGAVRISYESVSWKTDGTSGSGHNDIRIEVRVNNSGNWIEVGNGAYNAGNNYRFNGTFDAAPYTGDSIQVRARANGSWTNGQGGGETAVTDAIVVNLICTETVSVSANPQVCAVDQQGVAEGAVSFNIAPASGATVQVYANANFTGPVGGALGDDVVLDLSPGTYYWQATAANGFALDNPASGQFTIDPCEASVVVVSGNCVLNDNGVPVGVVEVTIDPDSGATVVVTGPGGPYNFSGDGGSIELAPGSYAWTASPGSGFALGGETSGEFTIDPCEASVIVVAGGCVVNENGAALGSVQVTIDPDSGATVVVTGPGGPYNLSGDGGSIELAPGSYAWTASPGSGFALGGETSGEFTIDPCDVSLLVVGGECEIRDGPTGSVTAFIDSDLGATVTVYDDELNAVATFSGSGGTSPLPPGTYTWEATSGDGFDFPDGQQTSGQFTIDPCESTVVVSHGNCVEGTATAFGSLTVVIDPVSAAVVTVLNANGQVVATFDEDGGSQALVAGAYTWSALANAGFALTGDIAGQFTVVACDDEVLDEEIENDDPEDEVRGLEVLPFTGIDTWTLFGASIVLLGSGWVLIRSARRREEG